jgi:pimeloyl-ACP methyl ester carboxylesterase/DNA-binding winged helix-turn-helix (wHTH) protein
VADRNAFGDCEIDPARRLLTLRGQPVDVEAKAFDLLIFLIAHRDRVVSSAELLEALWPGTVVTPGALSRAVHKARHAVGDDGEAQRVIATVHGRGFRFVAESHPVGGALPDETTGPIAGRRRELAQLEQARERAMKAETRYAREGDVHIAYRVFGDGPRDIVLIPGSVSHVELLWEFRANEILLRRLAAFARVIVFDKRGQGLSDRVGHQTLEERTGDVRAVMDAVGSERATICGWSEGGAMSLMFAATYPERTSALVLFGSYASIRAEPWGVPKERYELLLDNLDRHWGEGVLVGLNAPSRAHDAAFVRQWAQLERASASPGAIVALFRANYDIDVRHVLPTIQVPTLILHRQGDVLVPVRAGRYLAEQIPGAKYVELLGRDHLLQAYEEDVLDRLIGEIEAFVPRGQDRSEPDRVLATVMFTGIVGSTERALELGDRSWLALRNDFYSSVRGELDAFRGKLVDTAGDRLLATFDGPARAIRCACSIRERVRALGLEIRTGLHTGECELIDGGVGGIAVHIAARVAAEANPGEVLVSSTVRDLVAGSQLRFADRGTHQLEGLPDELRLFAVQ